MNILLAFAPFLVFAVVDHLAGATAGLAAGAVVAGGLFLRDVCSSTRKVKVLEAGTLVLFGGLALYSLIAKPAWSILGVRLCVDLGLLVIVLMSMAVGRPFTVQYARESVPEAAWTRPEFLRVNYVITAVWAAAFAIMVIADLVMLQMPNVPLRVGIWTTILAIFGAVKFTSWYPDRRKA